MSLKSNFMTPSADFVISAIAAPTPGTCFVLVAGLPDNCVQKYEVKLATVDVSILGDHVSDRNAMRYVPDKFAAPFQQPNFIESNITNVFATVFAPV